MDKKVLTSRQVVSELQHDSFAGEDFDKYMKEKVLHNMAKGLAEHIEVKQWHDTEYHFHIYEADAVILTPREYNAMKQELDMLREKTWRLEHLIKMGRA